MADTDPNSSEHNIWSTLNGSYRGHIRRKRIVAAVIVLLLLAPLTVLVVSQILQNRTPIGVASTSAATVEVPIDQVTPTETLSQDSGATDTPTLAQIVSVTPIVLPSETATEVPPTETATATSTATGTATPVPTDTPQPTATKEVSGQSVASTTFTPTPAPTHKPPTATSTSTPTAQPTPQALNPVTGGETPGLNLYQTLGLILLSMVLILLGSALIAQPARR